MPFKLSCSHIDPLDAHQKPSIAAPGRGRLFTADVTESRRRSLARTNTQRGRFSDGAIQRWQTPADSDGKCTFAIFSRALLKPDISHRNGTTLRVSSRSELRSPEATQLTSASDRKSTRLNSSHANISYAVFCL